ncbi:hypothetical protein CQW23_24083 [Capsicum baccatum]|uniref:Uncharacterized protein n=1 Tax=Capsicum baccatum TaxID=33114 RepID=A0A2G2VTV7_CAPBA|nr:hypothetical protein CQW23_24083 [Capsicum baccatum]
MHTATQFKSSLKRRPHKQDREEVQISNVLVKFFGVGENACRKMRLSTKYVWFVTCLDGLYRSLWFNNSFFVWIDGMVLYVNSYVELIDPPPSSTSHRPRCDRPLKIPIPISILLENSNPENRKILKGVNGVAASLISSEDTTMLNARVVSDMDVVVKKRVKLKKRVYKVKKSKRV